MSKQDEQKKNAVPFEEEESSDSEQQGAEAQNTPSQEQDDSDDTASEQDSQDQAQGDQTAPAEEEESSDEPEQEKPKARTSPKKSPAKSNQAPKKAPQKAASNADVGIEYKKMSDQMKKHLQSQPKVQFMIPLAPNEKEGAWESVQINGYRMVIKKGTMVTIPQQVAQILADHYQIQMEAGKEHLIQNKGQDVEDALTE